MALNVEYVYKVIDRFSGPLGRMNRQVENLNKRIKQASINAKKLGDTLKSKLSLPLAAFGTIGILAAARFEEQMNTVAAVTQATGEQFEQLKKQAKDMGIATQFSASQAAAGQAFLGQAGFDTNQILKTLPATLNLAAAGSLGLASAADITSNIMQGFQADVADAGRFVDVLAMASSKSNTNVFQLGDAMKFVAPVASKMGLSIEQSAAAIGALSNAGLQGSMAGTGLRRVLSELANPSKKLKKALGGASIETHSFAQIMDIFKKRGISAGEALEFFGDRGGPALLALVGQTEGMKKLNEQLLNAEGTAKRMAVTKMKGLPGAIKRLQSAIEGALIALFGVKDVATAIDKVANSVRKLATTIENMSPASKKMLLVFGLFLIVLGPILSLLGSIGLAFMAFGGVVTAAVVLIGAGIGALVFLFGDLKQKSGGVWTAFAAMGLGALNLIMGAADRMMSFLMDALLLPVKALLILIDKIPFVKISSALTDTTAFSKGASERSEKRDMAASGFLTNRIANTAAGNKQAASNLNVTGQIGVKALPGTEADTKSIPLSVGGQFAGAM